MIINWLTNPDVVRAAALYLPLLVALMGAVLHGRRPRRLPAILLGILWVMPMLLLLQSINVFMGWWSFQPSGTQLRGMPLEFFAGWVILWAVMPQLVFPRLSLAWVAFILIAADWFLMPFCQAAMHLNATWPEGELAAAFFILFPALWIARWTAENSHLKARAAIQIVISGLVFLYFIPEIVFALKPQSSAQWAVFLHTPGWLLQICLQILFVLAIPGISAVMEFAERGYGTPIPYDPPTRLVTSGIYRYIANPMQISCTIVMLLWSCILQNRWLILAALMSAIYSYGIAKWNESQDLPQRFGFVWLNYRAEVKNWRFRWRPYHTGENARIYIASTCGPCSEIRTWLQARNPIGLEIIAAETLPAGSIRRMRYDPADGCKPVDGIRAFGRTLEHLHLGWALSGFVLRLPFLWQLVQLLMDVSGFGPRKLEAENNS